MVADEATGSYAGRNRDLPAVSLLVAIGQALAGGRHSTWARRTATSRKAAPTPARCRPSMLASVGCEYVILGHSERRQYFREDDELLSQKLKAALAAGLKPIFCVGESAGNAGGRRDLRLLGKQLQGRPVWPLQRRIRAGRRCLRAHLGHRHGPHRHQPAGAGSARLYPRADGPRLRRRAAIDTTILYGGSANAQNARELFGQPDVDGGLIGGAALKARDFTEIVKSF